MNKWMVVLVCVVIPTQFFAQGRSQADIVAEALSKGALTGNTVQAAQDSGMGTQAAGAAGGFVASQLANGVTDEARLQAGAQAIGGRIQTGLDNGENSTVAGAAGSAMQQSWNQGITDPARLEDNANFAAQVAQNNEAGGPAAAFMGATEAVKARIEGLGDDQAMRIGNNTAVAASDNLGFGGAQAQIAAQTAAQASRNFTDDERVQANVAGAVDVLNQNFAQGAGLGTGMQGAEAAGKALNSNVPPEKAFEINNTVVAERNRLQEENPQMGEAALFTGGMAAGVGSQNGMAADQIRISVDTGAQVAQGGLDAGRGVIGAITGGATAGDLAANGNPNAALIGAGVVDQTQSQIDQGRGISVAMNAGNTFGAALESTGNFETAQLASNTAAQAGANAIDAGQGINAAEQSMSTAAGVIIRSGTGNPEGGDQAGPEEQPGGDQPVPQQEGEGEVQQLGPDGQPIVPAGQIPEGFDPNLMQQQGGGQMPQGEDQNLMQQQGGGQMPQGGDQNLMQQQEAEVPQQEEPPFQQQ